jgi:hypothetical protein
MSRQRRVDAEEKTRREYEMFPGEGKTDGRETTVRRQIRCLAEMESSSSSRRCYESRFERGCGMRNDVRVEDLSKVGI